MKYWVFITLICVTLTQTNAAEWCLKPAEEISGASVADGEETKPTMETIQQEQDMNNNDVPKCSVKSEDLISGMLVNGTGDRPENFLPPWINLTLATRGQQWARDHITLLSGSHIFGLAMILAFPDMNAVLLFTNQSDTRALAMKRYSRTIREVNTWYNQSLEYSPDGSDLMTSLLRVRGLHTAAKNAGNERMHGENPRPLINKELYERIPLDNGMWEAFETDLKNSKIDEKSRKVPSSYKGREGKYYAVNQFQQALTQYAFVGFPVLFPERLFILDSKEEDLHAYNHLWAVLGYALGIEDEYNIALQPDLKSAREYYQHIFDYWYLPQLFNLDFHSKVLMEAQLQGFEDIEPILSPRTILLRLLRDIVNIPVPQMTKELSPKDHGKMLQYHIQGLRGFMDKIHNDKDFRQTIQQTIHQNIKTKLQQIFTRT